MGPPFTTKWKNCTTNYSFVVFRWRRATPTKPTKPEPNSQTAAGTGTAGPADVLMVPSRRQLAWKLWKEPPGSLMTLI